MQTKVNQNARVGIFALVLLFCLINETAYAQLKPKSMLLPSFGPNPKENDRFGYTVAASWNTVLVGAYLEDLDADGMNFMQDAGAAYIMEKNEAGVWEIQQKLTPSDRSPGDNFGGAVDIRGEYAIIGSANKTYHPPDDPGDSLVFAGAVYVFHRDQSGKWIEEQKLLPDIPSAYGQFGYSLSLGLNDAIVGAPGESYDENGENFATGAGAIYAYERIADSVLAMNTPVDPKNGYVSIEGRLWLNQKITAYDRQENDLLGFNVMKQRGNVFAVALGLDYRGFIYVLKRIDRMDLPAGTGWVFLNGTPKLTLGVNSQSFAFFGEGLAMKNGLFFGGAPGLNYGTNSETVYHVGGVNCQIKVDEDNFLDYGLIRPPDIIEYNYFGGQIFLRKMHTPFIYSRDPLVDTYIKFYRLFITSLFLPFEEAFNINFPQAGCVTDFSVRYSTKISFDEKEVSEIHSKADENLDINLIRSLIAEDPAAGDNFGFALDGSGNDLVIGAPMKDYIIEEDTTADAGAVYFFEICDAVDTTIAETVCDSFASPDGNFIWTESGTYMDTLTNYLGCDSIITVELTVNSIDNTVSQTEGMLEVNQEDAAYQWIDCDNNYMPIEGATEKTFIAEESGNYAVQIILGDCADTSACNTVNLTGLPLTRESMVRLYPNPGTTGFYTLELGKNYHEVSIEIINSSGQIISDRTYTHLNSVDMQINGPKGIYLVRICADQQEFISLKAIKQ